MEDYAADYLALKEANDRLREQGKTWLWEKLSEICAELGPAVQLGRQEWRFEVGRSVMVGERFGVRHQSRTLIVEAGWPREPEHGHVPGQGLARGRVSLSLNPALPAKATDELVLRGEAGAPPSWYVIHDRRPADPVTESRLRAYLQTVVT